MEENTALPLAEEILEPSLPLEAQTGESLPPDEPKVEPTPAEANPPKWKLQFNRETIEVDHEKVVEYAQKGMNYDKLQERLKGIESELETLRKPLEPVAQKLGKKPNEVTELFAKQWQIAEDAKLARAQNKPVQDVTALREEREAREAAEAKARELETAEQTRQRHLQETGDFQKEFPNVDILTLPDEVKNDWLNNGKPLKEAYRIHAFAELQAENKRIQERIKEMEAQEKAAAINAENAATAPGKLGEGATAEQPLTDKAIEEMSPAELDKNHKRIWAYLTGAKN